MRKAILVISGFTERDHENTGSRQLWESLSEFENDGAHDNLVFVTLKEWNHNWKEFGAWLDLLGVSECFVCAYSWGAGHGLKKLAKSFSGQISCILCDPVYRSKLIPFRWLALFDMTIKYPKNVLVKRWFYQKLDEPGGDKVKGAPRGT